MAPSPQTMPTSWPSWTCGLPCPLPQSEAEAHSQLLLSRPPHRSYAAMALAQDVFATAMVLSQDQGYCTSLDAANSGHGSWTSCSSDSHNNIQTIQHLRSWETPLFGPVLCDYPGDPMGPWASRGHLDHLIFAEDGQKGDRQIPIEESLEQAQSRARWASPTGCKDMSLEAENGSSLAPAPTEEPKAGPVPALRVATSSATKGLVGKSGGTPQTSSSQAQVVCMRMCPRDAALLS